MVEWLSSFLITPPGMVLCILQRSQLKGHVDRRGSEDVMQLFRDASRRTLCYGGEGMVDQLCPISKHPSADFRWRNT